MGSEAPTLAGLGDLAGGLWGALALVGVGLVVGLLRGRTGHLDDPGPVGDQVERARRAFRRMQAERRARAEAEAARERAELEARRAADSLDERRDDLLERARRRRGGDGPADAGAS